jgi:DNA-directed RNA polymerase specialized sigma24 family protein
VLNAPSVRPRWGTSHSGQGNRPVAQGGTDAQHQFANVPEEAPLELEADEEHDSALIVRRAAELLQHEFEQRTWQAFWQAAMAERTAAEIAAELGMTTNAVYLAKSRVLRRLREELANMLDININ